MPIRKEENGAAVSAKMLNFAVDKSELNGADVFNVPNCGTSGAKTALNAFNVPVFGTLDTHRG